MRRKSVSVLAAVFALPLGGVPASAHQGFAVEFDGSKCTDMRGTLTGIGRTHTHILLRRILRTDKLTKLWEIF